MHRLAVTALYFLLSGFSVHAAEELERRWVFVGANLLVADELDRVEAVLDRAAASGYNGILLSDYKSSFWWRLENASTYRSHCNRLHRMLKARNMELAVSLFPFGYAGPLLWDNQNLATGVPVRKVAMTLEGDELKFIPGDGLPNGSLDNSHGDQIIGTRFQDSPGLITFVDETTKQGSKGKASLRIENAGKAANGNGRICFRLKVNPRHQYRVRFWMKAKNLKGGLAQGIVLGAKGGRGLVSQSLVRPDNDGDPEPWAWADDTSFDWTEQLLTFNSLDQTEVDLYLGIWEGETGALWVDNISVENVSTLNLVRRDSLPLAITSEDGSIEYKEGGDFHPVQDSQLGQIGWQGNFNVRHEAPTIRITENSKIKPGEPVYLSAFHTSIMENGQVTCSLLDEEVFKNCETSLQLALQALDPDIIFMGHDEIRVGGWEPELIQRFPTTGEMLAENMRQCQDIIERVAPGKEKMVWSDMFDPHHNAHEDYYLVNNTLAGSWEGLKPTTMIMNWGDDTTAKSLNFFAKRGHTQMVATYYDQDVEENYAHWQKAMADVPNIKGVMFTTWEENFDELEKFAETWWGKVKAE